MKHLALFSSCHWDVGQVHDSLFITTVSFQKQVPWSQCTSGSPSCNLCVQTRIHVHPWAPLGTYHGMGYQDWWVLNLHTKERWSFSITLSLHGAFDDSKDHLCLLQAEQLYFILHPGQVRQITTQKKKPKHSPHPPVNRQRFYAKLFKNRITILSMPSCWNSSYLFTAAQLSCSSSNRSLFAAFWSFLEGGLLSPQK